MNEHINECDITNQDKRTWFYGNLQEEREKEKEEGEEEEEKEGREDGRKEKKKLDGGNSMLKASGKWENGKFKKLD